MNKNNIKQLVSLSFLITSMPIFGYIPVQAKILQEYADPIKTAKPINASGLDIRGANLGQLFFTGGGLSGVHAEPCQAGQTHSKFAVCHPRMATNLVGSKFLGVNLASSNFSNALLSSVDFTGSILWKVVLAGADLRNTIWDNARVLFTIFTNANLTGAKGLENLQDDFPGATTFCNATMPDGTICSPGTMWNNKIDCNCPSSSDSSSNSNS